MKKNLVTVVLGVVGTLLLGVGMSLVLVEEFKALLAGIIIGSIGLLALLALLPIWIKPKKVSFKLVLTYTVGIIGTLLLGVSLTFALKEGIVFNELITSLAFGIPGILIIAFNPLVYKQTSRKEETVIVIE
ncbi:MAG: hypothetical protein LBM99_00935 [Bacillales bacterium]|nr:hypothetical protein [Bacillales bacterium]